LNNHETPEEESNSYIKEDTVKCESKPRWGGWKYNCDASSPTKDMDGNA